MFLKSCKNRLSIDNLTLGITTEINVHISPPFLLYQNKDTGEPPYGIWFYSQFDCNRISQLVKKLHSEVVEKSKAEPVEQKVKPPPGLFPAQQQQQAETPKDDKVDILGGWFFSLFGFRGCNHTYIRESFWEMLFQD